MPQPILHIYQQAFPHDMPSIVGTAEALDILRAAIGNALARGEARSQDVLDSAGESYVVKVCCRLPHKAEAPPGNFREKLGKDDLEPLPSAFWERLGAR